MSVEYVPGYDWVPGKFGPPPGIPKDQKDQFDRLSDKEFLYAFLKLNQEEKVSLMVSEAERRRTFAACWPKESIVRGEDCAREGFYYTGAADSVQCAFCGGFVRNWERGDVPKLQHQTFFNFCKIVQNKPCKNIPVDQEELAVLIMTNQLSSPSGDNERGKYRETGVDHALNVFSKRIQTYNGYPCRDPAQINKLCDAGFVYEGVGDRVKCFWCNGTLQMWEQRDEPWFEHAKWYPACQYLQEKKGTDFVKQVRLRMSEDDIKRIDALAYNQSDLAFLTDDDMLVPPDDAVAGVQLGRKINVYALLTSEVRSEQDTNDLLSVIGRCWKCKRRCLPCGVLMPCGHLYLCEACCEEPLPKTCGYRGEEVDSFFKVIFTE